MGIISSAVQAADYDSLAAYRALGRAATNFTVGTFPDSVLDYVINLAAGFVQADLKSQVTTKRISMTARKLTYGLDSTMISNQVVMVIWKKLESREEYALQLLPPEMIGKPMNKSGPYYYTILKRTLTIHNQSVAADSLIVYYVPMATRMTAVSDAAGIDETDAVAVAYLTAAFISANRKDYQNQAFWWAVYQGYKRAKLGIVDAPQN